MTNNTSSKDLAGRSEGREVKKLSGARENRGHYVDGPHARDPSEYFYAIAPAYLQTYQNPWNARIIRGSKATKGAEKGRQKSKLSKVLDRIMAVAITYKLSPYKKDIRRQAKHFESRRDTTWARQIGSMFIVAAGGFVGTGLRFGDWLRRIAARGKQSVANIRIQQREHVLAAAIVSVASLASIGVAGTYVFAQGGYTPVEPITVQSNTDSSRPVGKAASADDADKNNGQNGAGASTDCSEGDSDTVRSEISSEEQDSHSTTETTTSTQQSDGSGETASSSTKESTDTTDDTTDTTDSNQDSTEQDTITCLTEQTQSTLDDPFTAVEPTDEYCLE